MEIVLLSFLIFTETYIAINILGIFVLNNNLAIFWNKKGYALPFNAQLKTVGKINYWVAKNPSGKHSAVVILHGWGENSLQMIRQAELYWELGYDLYLIDGPGHGMNGWYWFPTGVAYSEFTHCVIQAERLSEPLIHGLSFGAIAATILAIRHPEIPSVLILEAVPSRLDDVYADFLRFAKIPPILFALTTWMSKLIFSLRYRHEFPQKYSFKNLKMPTLIIYGEKDNMFSLDKHFPVILNDLKQNPLAKTWIANGKGHANISTHPQFKNQITDFLNAILHPS